LNDGFVGTDGYLNTYFSKYSLVLACYYFCMDKALLHKNILAELNSQHQNAVDAAMQAYNTATHEENIADNKYDTLGLEASYLAQGQAKRVTECAANLTTFSNLKINYFTDESPISVGALIFLKSDSESQQILFMAPVSGGLKVNYGKKEVTIITPSAPLGKKIMGHYVGDEIEVELAGREYYYEIISIY